MEKGATTAQQVTDAAVNFSESYKRLTVELVKRQNEYMKRTSGGNGTLSYVVTPDMVTYYNYMHEVMRSMLANVPTDVCGTTGGFMCTNLQMVAEPTAEGMVTLRDLKPMTDGTAGKVDGGVDNNVLATALKILNTIDVTAGNNDRGEPSVYREFLANMHSISQVMESRLRVFDERVAQVTSELAIARRDLKRCEIANAGKEDARSVMDQVNRLTRDNRNLAAKVDEYREYAEMVVGLVTRDVTTVDEMRHTMDELRQRLYRSHDEQSRHMLDTMTRMLDEMKVQNSSLLYGASVERFPATTTISGLPKSDTLIMLDDRNDQTGLVDELRRQVRTLTERLGECESEVRTLRAQLAMVSDAQDDDMASPSRGMGYQTRLKTAYDRIAELEAMLASTSSTTAALPVSRSAANTIFILDELLDFKKDIQTPPQVLPPTFTNQLYDEGDTYTAMAAIIAMMYRYNGWANQVISMLVRLARVADESVKSIKESLCKFLESHGVRQEDIVGYLNFTFNGAVTASERTIEYMTQEIEFLQATQIETLLQKRDGVLSFFEGTEVMDELVSRRLVTQATLTESSKRLVRKCKDEMKKMRKRLTYLEARAIVDSYVQSNAGTGISANANKAIATIRAYTKDYEALRSEVIRLRDENNRLYNELL